MVNDIIREIRLMERKFCEKYNKRGKFIYLDANAEARLAACIILRIAKYGCDTVCSFTSVEKILECGIRSLSLRICGMEVFFNYETFCIKGEIGGPSYPITETVPYRIIKMVYNTDGVKPEEKL